MRRPGRLDPDGCEVHVWTVRLEASEETFARSLSWLSPDETARAGRFHFDRHRRAFVLGRAALRWLLAGYLGSAPADVRFTYGPKGKPALADAGPLRFNASNSGILAAYSFIIGCEIGIDIEQHRALTDIESIVRRFFSPEEAADLRELSEAERTPAFFNCWTRKEAYIKAVGDGLSVPLDSFRVAFRPGVAPRIWLAGSVEPASAWTLHDFTPAVGYAGAVVYSGESRPVVSRPLVTMDDLLDELLKGTS
jgi:4'-phosphopantetheinyl transferase